MGPHLTLQSLHFLISEMGVISCALAPRCLERLRPTNGLGTGTGLGSPGGVRGEAHPFGAQRPCHYWEELIFETLLNSRVSEGDQGLGPPPTNSPPSASLLPQAFLSVPPALILTSSSPGKG